MVDTLRTCPILNGMTSVTGCWRLACDVHRVTKIRDVVTIKKEEIQVLAAVMQDV